MAPFKAWIIPIDDEGKPPANPPGIWGGANEPFPGYGLPGRPPGTWGGSGEGFPTHPIAGRPPGTWGGAGEGFPTPPIVIPPDKPGVWPPLEHPAHPIVIPPPADKPPTGGDSGSINQPINLPPDSLKAVSHGFWQQAYFPELGGWLWTWVVVEVEKSAGKK